MSDDRQERDQAQRDQAQRDQAGRGDRTAVFEEHRERLFGIAYRMLGSVADAEDLVQDAWLKWSQVDRPVEHPGAYLARTVTNLALNRLSSAAVQRERYVGPWLPEPLVRAPDVADEIEQAESVSLAMLVVLESLSPLERAVFILREVFGFPHREIAQTLGRSEQAVRQLSRRAASHVAARRPRFDTSEEEQRQVTAEFLDACVGGDLHRMLASLAPDVVLWSDGGGKRSAALRPIEGADKVARWIMGVRERFGPAVAHPAEVNGGPGAVFTVAGEVDSVVAVDVRDGRVVAIRVVRNPDKLRHVRVSGAADGPRPGR
ncbi:RNA polymerase sigma-70 factor [Streptomyces sp. YIM 98790]|uniref:RNA polymerase sigma-70 factor n=1 Tax=Streptomyces sp. YIM 98790 TaxID=2689077 RepID=UPI00140CE692|nr:RNA polymerase sigma-70 factor [Streptomyces sp. YIM 98790]